MNGKTHANLPNKKPSAIFTDGLKSGGGSEIRTHGGRKPSPVFKTGAFNRSAIPPG